MHVLVSEDDAMLAAVVKDALEDEGHAVTCVATPGEACELAERQSWDVALVDGFGDSYAEVNPEEIRGTLTRLSTSAPVVLSTGRVWAQAARPAELGVAAILPKPYDLDTLIAVLEQAAREPCFSTG